MNKSSTAVNGTAHPAPASSSDANSGQISKKDPDANKVSLRAKNKDRQGPHHIEEPKQRPLSTISPSDVTPGFNQRRWSADFCTCGNTTCIIVRKKKKQPRPPQRCLALLQPYTASYTSVKRYSCPPVGTLTSPGRSSSSSPSSSTNSSCSSPPPAQTSVGNFTSPGQSSSPSSSTTSPPPAQTSVGNFTSPSQSSSSSPSSSTTSSCSSPPPAPTSVIAGPDPRGWKVNPKPSSTSSHRRTNSLSRQIPLPVTPPPNTPNPGPSTKAALTPKPFCRHHSDSSASLRSLRSPRSGVTVEELCAVRLRHITLSDDDVFTKGAQDIDRVAARPGKIPPPVPEKTAMARQIAQLISRSRQRCGPVTAKSNKNEKIYTGVMKPKAECSQQIVNNRSIRVTKTAGLHLHISCDRERSTPHFPG